MKILLLGRRGKVGSVLGPALEAAGHELVESTGEAEVAVDFTRPDAVEENVRACLEDRAPVVVGTTGFDQERVAALARVHELPVFYAPNFALGAVLMLRFSAEAAKVLPHAEIVELHHESKLDAPSGTAKATAELLPPGTPIHSVRLPGLVAHQEVIFGGAGADADDPARHDLARGVRPGRPPRARARTGAAAGPHGGARRPPVIEFAVGDLTVQQVDAIVNAANPSLLGGGGVDGAIHRAGGPEILAACRLLGGCATGDAKATTAGRLPARWVIHAVGPVWRGGEEGEPELLAAAHRRSLEVARELGARTVAFPAISCGLYGYPPERAASVAIDAARRFEGDFDEIRFVFLGEELRDVFRHALEG